MTRPFDIDSPDHCVSLREVRKGIDQIDRTLVQLLSQRAGFVARAAEFKNSEAEVRAPNRVRELLAERRRWAQEDGVSAELIDEVFRTVVEHFVGREVDRWRGGEP